MRELGILCSGQGNQYPGMFEIVLGCPAAENVLRSAMPFFGCHPAEYLQQLSMQDLFCNRTAQLLIGTLQMAIWAVLRETLPPANVFAGYSMGELTSYGCANALSVEETLALIEKRAKVMNASSPQGSGLLAIRGLNRVEIDSLCRSSGVEIAIINGPAHFVVGGPEKALSRCEGHPLIKKSSKLKRLQVDVPSHTSWLGEASSRFERELSASSMRSPSPSVLAGVSGAVVRTREQAIVSLAQQISQPINWMACMQTVVEMGCGVILELGPGNALTKMLQDVSSDITVRSVGDFRSLQGVATWVEKQCL